MLVITPWSTISITPKSDCCYNPAPRYLKTFSFLILHVVQIFCRRKTSWKSLSSGSTTKSFKNYCSSELIKSPELSKTLSWLYFNGFFLRFLKYTTSIFSAFRNSKIVTQKTSEIPGNIFKYSQAIALDKNLTFKNLSRWRTWSIFGQVWLSRQRSHLDENLVKFEAFKNVLVEPTSQV